MSRNLILISTILTATTFIQAAAEQVSGGLAPTSTDSSHRDPISLQATSNDDPPKDTPESRFEWVPLPGLSTAVLTGSNDSSLLVIAVLSGMQRIEGAPNRHPDTRFGLRLLVDGIEVHRAWHEFRGGVLGAGGLKPAGWSLRDGVLCACIPSVSEGKHEVSVEWFAWDFTARAQFSMRNATGRLIAVEVFNGNAVVALKQDLRSLVGRVAGNHDALEEDHKALKADYIALKDELAALRAELKALAVHEAKSDSEK